MTIKSRVEGGKLMQNVAKINAEIRKHEGKFIEITIKRKYKRRSIPENRYYFGVVIQIWKDLIFDEWGESWSSEQTHEFLKSQCIFKEMPNKETGELIKVPLSTADLKTVEFEEYLEKCRRLAFDFFNVQIPLPNEQTILNFENYEIKKRIYNK